MAYWLMKTEPRTYSWQDLLNEKDKTTQWEGVRNYQARNFMRDRMRKGDRVFIYHSVVKPMAIMGIAQIVREGYPDYFAFDSTSRYYDPNSLKQNPRWYMVDIQARFEFKNPITLDRLKGIPGLENMMLLQKGSRLSVQPVGDKEWNLICNLEQYIPV